MVTMTSSDDFQWVIIKKIYVTQHDKTHKNVPEINKNL